MGNPTIHPDVFARAMETHWSNALGNVSSPSLVKLWEAMGKAYNGAISGTNGQWTVLQPPTGTGKTQGLAVYSALTANSNRDGKLMNGILIVTRLIEQAEELKETINHLAGFKCAQTKHSENKVAPDEIRESDILIVTHAAYVKALGGMCDENDARLADLIEWRGGKRSLTVIDEALSSVIEDHQVRAEDLRQVLGYLNPETLVKHPQLIGALETVRDVLEKIAVFKPSDNYDNNRSRVVWRGVLDEKVSFPSDLSMKPLRETMKSLRYDHLALHKESPLDCKRISLIVDTTLKGVEAILSRWSWYAKKGLEHSFNCSQLLIPDDLPAPVVLDATANQNFLWELLEDRANIKPIPSNTRSYSNVTLHVARATSVGKSSMVANGQTRIPRLLHQLQNDIGSKRKVFLCLHKKIEHIPLKYEPEFAEFSVGHWGAIDGRNQWKDFDTAVIFGIPFRDHIWATNAFFALQGLQDNEWLRSPQWKSYADVREEMQTKQVTVSIIQAINRIQCRRVIDINGNCPLSDVFIALPKGGRGDRILEAIKQEMPSIKEQAWDFELDGVKAKVRRGSSHASLLTFMANRLGGETSLSLIQKELGLAEEGMKTLRSTLRDNSHSLTTQLRELGVNYMSNGYGKGSRSYLLKA